MSWIPIKCVQFIGFYGYESELKSILGFDFRSVRLYQTNAAKGKPMKQVF